MKLAIISDCHIGKRQYRTDENNYNRFEWLGYQALNENVDIILKEKPDLLINAGDSFETPNPSVLAITNYSNAMNKLRDIPTMTILGNHDFSFANMNNKCSAVSITDHTYFADYKIKTVELEGILFVMMPYIYGKSEVIKDYLEECEQIASQSTCNKKILVTHGVTEKYYKDSFISDPIMLSDKLIEKFSLVIIGHIHTPFDYYQGKTLVISPGAMIDYQAHEDHTGPIFLDTDTMKFKKVKIKTPHIIKLNCNAENINECLSKVTEDIYKITYDGDLKAINDDLFITAKNMAVNLIIDIVLHESEIDASTSSIALNVYDWVTENHSEYKNIFINAKEVIEHK